LTASTDYDDQDFVDRVLPNLHKISKNMQVGEHLEPKILKVVSRNPSTPYVV
jgi:hypothetical protein